MLLLDRTARLALSVPDDKVLKRHKQERAARLMAVGVATELAGMIREARRFA